MGEVKQLYSELQKTELTDKEIDNFFENQDKLDNLED